MAQPTETFDAFDVVGNREDLENVIYNISPIDTPFMAMADRIDADAVLHEWQTDSLAAAAANAAIEGDNAEGEAIVETQRLNNRTQISDKVISISGTLEAIDKAGRQSEIAYQLAKKGRELKRDMEFILTGNNAITVGSKTIARTLGSLDLWYTNSDRGTGGADCARTTGQPDTDKTATDAGAGDRRALTEAQVQNAIQLAWTDGGDPTVIISGPVNKQRFSAFTGHSTRFDRGEDKRLVAAIDIYVSDFGTHRIVANRFSRDRDLHVLDPKLWAVAYLRSFRQHALAKTGDSEQRQLLAEYTLVARNESGSAIVADLTA